MNISKDFIQKCKKEATLALGVLVVLSTVLAIFSINVDVAAAQSAGDYTKAHAGAMTREEDHMERLPEEFNFRTLAVMMINWLLGFVGLVAVGMFIYGGFMYITAHGEQGGVDKGKKTMIYAVIGIAVVMLSFAIVNTLLGSWETGEDSQGGTYRQD